MKLERVQKLLSQAGIASRRHAEEMIAAGRVHVNGVVATLGSKASFTDKITVDGASIEREEKVYFLLNKPRQVVTTVSDPQGRTTVLDLVKSRAKIFPVGRLDYDTSGTLILTNDGELAHRLMHPSFEIKKVYRARLSEALSPEQLTFLNSSMVRIDHKPVTQKVTSDGPKSYLVVIHEGLNHHVKKLFELVDREVLHLTRLEFAGLTHIGTLPTGKYRALKPAEIRWLKQLTKL